MSPGTPAQQCAAVISRLGGAARYMARLMGPAEVHQGGMVDGVQLDPASFLVNGLSAQLAPLDDERRLQAVTRLPSFSRRPNDTVDNLIARFEVARQQVVVDGGFSGRLCRNGSAHAIQSVRR